MTPEYVIHLGQEAIYLMLIVSAPMLLAGLVVGLGEYFAGCHADSRSNFDVYPQDFGGVAGVDDHIAVDDSKAVGFYAFVAATDSNDCKLSLKNYE